MMPNPMPVHVAGITWTGALVGLLNVLVGGALVAAIRNWPRLRELTIGQRKDDLDDMRKRITDLETKVESASAAAHSAEMKLVYAVSAVQLLAAKIRADNPNDPTLLQALELLAAATGGEMPGWAGKLSKGVAKIKGEEA
jgi:HAMP domain-containing protein